MWWSRHSLYLPTIPIECISEWACPFLAPWGCQLTSGDHRGTESVFWLPVMPWLPRHPFPSHFVPSLVIFIFLSSWSLIIESCIFLILLLSILTFFFSMLISQKEGKRRVLAEDPAATWLYPQFCWLFSCNISMVCDMLWYNIIW